MRKKRREENKRITIRCNIDKGAFSAACTERMEAKHSTRKCLRQCIEIVHGAEHTPVTHIIAMVRNRINMAHKKSTIAMSNKFDFDFARYERLVAKPVEHNGQHSIQFAF